MKLNTVIKSAQEGLISWSDVARFGINRVKKFMGSAMFYCSMLTASLLTLGLTLNYGFLAPAFIFGMLIPACSSKD